jgi:hypothetical protein
MRNGGGFNSPVSGLTIFGEPALFIRAWSDDGVAMPTSYILFDAGKISRYVGATVVNRRDAKQLATLFSSACHFTTAAVHIDGGDALEHLQETLFLKRPDVTLVHQTDRIVVNENWEVASERGEWIERWTEKDGTTELRGSYLACGEGKTARGGKAMRS